MSEHLDWLRTVIDEPVPQEPVPGQLDLGLATLRVWDHCACGGSVSVDDDGDVMAAVARHHQGNRHKEWRLLGGMDLPLCPEHFGRVPLA